MSLAMQDLETGPFHRFRDWPNEQVPKRAAGVYTVWEGGRLLYVGMSGRAMTAEDLEVSDGGRVVAKGLWTRLNAHASGRRSGDQFCVYVGDRFVVPELSPSQQRQLAAGTLSLDSLIRAFVRERLGYRFVVTADGSEAARLEGAVRRGDSRWVSRISIRWIVEARPLLCENKYGRPVTRRNAETMAPTLAFAVVACRLVLAGCRVFAAYSPPCPASTSAPDCVGPNVPRDGNGSCSS